MAFIIDVKVTPNSSKKGWSIDKSGNIKCHVKSEAQQGKANDELIKSLSKALGIARDLISITSGQQSRKKRIKIDVEMTFDHFLQLLGIEWQMDMF